MSAVVSEMLIRIAADTAQLRSEMNEAKRAVGSGFDDIKGMASSLRSTLVGAFAAISVTALAKQFVEIADAMSLLEARLKNAVGPGKAFAEAQADIYRISQQNNIGLQEAATLYTKLFDPVQRLGGGTRETAKIVESFALSLRVGGASAQEASSATLQFAQAMASGKLQGDEFRSMAEASPRFMKAMAEGMGVPIEKLKQMASEGKLTADVVGNALIKSLEQLKSEAAGLPDTVAGAFTRFKNEATLAAVAVNNLTGITGALADGIGMAADIVKEITAVFRSLNSQAGTTGSGLSAMEIIIGSVGKALEAVILIGSDVKYVFETLGRQIGGFAAMIASALRGDFEAASNIRTQMIEDSKRHRDELEKFQRSVAGATDRVLQQREVLRTHSLTAAENANEIDRLNRRYGQKNDVVLKSNAIDEEAVKAEQKRLEQVKKLIDGIEDQTGALLAAEQANGKLTSAQQTALKVMQDIQQGRIKLTDAEKQAVGASLELLIATEKRITVAKELETYQRKAAEFSTKLTEAQWKETEALREGNVKLIEQNDVLRLGADAVRAREIAVLRSRATDLEWAAANEGGNQILEEQARLLRERANLMEDNAALQAAKDTADEWKKTSESIQSSLTDALMRGFESGKGFAQNLKDTLKNLFNSLVLRPIIQPIAQGAAGTLLSFLGMGNANASTGGASFGSSISNALTGGMNFLNGSTISSAASGFYTRAGDYFATSSNSTLGSIGDFMQANPQIGSYLGMAGNAFAGYSMGQFANTAISGGYSVGKGYNTFQQVGMAVGSAIGGPIVGAAIGAVTGLVNRAFGTKLAGQGVEGNFSAGGFEGNAYKFYKGGWFRSDKTVRSDLDAGMADALGMGASAVYAQIKNYADALALPAEQLKNVSSYMKVALTDDAAANQKAIADAVSAYGEALVNSFSDQLVPFQKEGEKLIDTLQRLSIIQTVSDSMNSLGGAFGNFAHASIDARESIISLAGGIDALMKKALGFVANYYTTNEQGGLTARAVQQGLEAAGFTAEQIAGLTGRSEFRALLEGLDVNTEAGQRQFVALLDLQEQFANVSQLMGDQKLSLAELAKQAPAVAALDKLFDPTKKNADAAQDMVQGIDKSNSLLESVVDGVNNTTTAVKDGLKQVSDSISTAINAVTDVAGQAANAATQAAASAAATATALDNVALLTSQQSYTFDLGGG